jgi:hypothetical protein
MRQRREDGMGYRVAFCGTGYVGRMALPLLLQQPGLQLVGHYVSTPEKAGKDSGELVGIGPLGVKATNSWRELIDLRADVLTYFADSVNRERQALEDVIPFLEAGTNVISISGWELGHRATMPPDLMEKLDTACRKGASSCFFTSIDPGWATSDLAIALLAAANRIDSVRMIEFANFAQYTAEYASREYFGFGQPPGFQPLLVRNGIIQEMWAPTLHRLADVLEVEIEEFRTTHDTDSVGRDIETGFGIVKAGTAAVVHFELQALKQGRPFLTLEHVDTVLPNFTEAGSQWSRPKAPDSSYRIEVEGDPAISLEFQNGASSSICATPVINAIPAVVAAPPGLVGPLDVPRYWSRNVTARLGPWP